MKVYSTAAGIMKALRTLGYQGPASEVKLPAPGHVAQFPSDAHGTVFLMGLFERNPANGKPQWSVFVG